jgi:hypothetical protein
MGVLVILAATGIIGTVVLYARVESLAARVPTVEKIAESTATMAVLNKGIESLDDRLIALDKRLDIIDKQNSTILNIMAEESRTRR